MMIGLSLIAEDGQGRQLQGVVNLLHVPKDDPTVFVFYEKYENDAALAQHGENLKAAGAGFVEILAGRPEIVHLEEI